MPLQLLEQLRHKHGVLTSGYTYGDLIPFLDHIVLIYPLGKSGKELLVEFLPYALLYFLLLLIAITVI